MVSNRCIRYCFTQQRAHALYYFRKMDLVSLIYHEQQEGQLCAQHALNNLLQQPLYTAINMSDIGNQLDLKEKEFGINETERNQNYDDSGFFSLQVIQQALQVFELNLVAFGSSEELAIRTRKHTLEANAYIANLNQHWFTLRKFGNSPSRWYNLNSNQKSPTYLSETYLELLLNQIQEQGYSVYIVDGQLPMSDADLYASENPIPEPHFVKFTSDDGLASNNEGDDLDPDTKKALQLSLQEGDDDQVQLAIQASLGANTDAIGEDEQLKMAIQASLSSTNIKGKGKQKRVKISEDEDIQRAIQASLMDDGTVGETSVSGRSTFSSSGQDVDLTRAIKLSMNDVSQGESLTQGELDARPVQFRVGPLITNAPPGASHPGSHPASKESEVEVMRRKRLEKLSGGK